MKRYSLNKKSSRRVFRKTAGRTHRVNMRRVARGGIRF